MALKNYRISFVLNGKHLWDYVSAPDRTQAFLIIQHRYPGATSFFITEER
jgi:hypothetical protein